MSEHKTTRQITPTAMTGTTGAYLKFMGLVTTTPPPSARLWWAFRVDEWMHHHLPEKTPYRKRFCNWVDRRLAGEGM